LYKDLLDRIRSIPGVQEVALASGIPMGRGLSGGPIEIEGKPKGEGAVRAHINVVTPGFFHTFNIRTVGGRVFDDSDRQTAPRVAVVSRAFAQAAWPGQNAVGKHVRHGFRVAFGDPKAWTAVVGVVDDAVYGTLEEPREPLIYLSAWQPLGTPAAISLAPEIVALRTANRLGLVVPALQQQLHAIDKAAALYDISTMSERAANLRSRYRYSAAIMGAVAGLALLLAAIGTYAVVAHSVATRTREIGIRVALGARPRDIATLVLRDGVRVAVAGIATGLGVALLGSRVTASMLYGVAPDDPLTFFSIALFMAAIVLLETYARDSRDGDRSGGSHEDRVTYGKSVNEHDSRDALVHRNRRFRDRRTVPVGRQTTHAPTVVLHRSDAWLPCVDPPLHGFAARAVHSEDCLHDQ
jgi:hypothetical protein